MPLARLNVISIIFQMVSWWFDRFFLNEISPPCIMLKQTLDPCPGLTVRFPTPYTFLTGFAVLPQRPGQLPVQMPGADQCFFYSVLIIPISAPQCQHFTIKSGYRPIVGVMNCTLVSILASIIRRPHFGHRICRILFFISCGHSSFFLHTSYIHLFLTHASGAEVYKASIFLFHKFCQPRGQRPCDHPGI